MLVPNTWGWLITISSCERKRSNQPINQQKIRFHFESKPHSHEKKIYLYHPDHSGLSYAAERMENVREMHSNLRRYLLMEWFILVSLTGYVIVSGAAALKTIWLDPKLHPPTLPTLLPLLMLSAWHFWETATSASRKQTPCILWLRLT